MRICLCGVGKENLGGIHMIDVMEMFKSLEAYALHVQETMLRFGATAPELALLSEELIRNNFAKRRRPEDVVWAILQ